MYARCMAGEQFWVLGHLTDAQLLGQLRCGVRCSSATASAAAGWTPMVYAVAAPRGWRSIIIIRPARAAAPARTICGCSAERTIASQPSGLTAATGSNDPSSAASTESTLRRRQTSEPAKLAVSVMSKAPLHLVPSSGIRARIPALAHRKPRGSHAAANRAARIPRHSPASQSPRLLTTRRRRRACSPHAAVAAPAHHTPPSPRVSPHAAAYPRSADTRARTPAVAAPAHRPSPRHTPPAAAPAHRPSPRHTPPSPRVSPHAAAIRAARIRRAGSPRAAIPAPAHHPRSAPRHLAAPYGTGPAPNYESGLTSTSLASFSEWK